VESKVTGSIEKRLTVTGIGIVYGKYIYNENMEFI